MKDIMTGNNPIGLLFVWALGVAVVGYAFPTSTTAAFISVLVLGALVGITELLSRYPDAPKSIFRYGAAWFYFLINAGASALALKLLLDFGVDFGFEPTESTKIWWAQVLTAGSASLVVLRSAFATYRVGGTDIRIGLDAILNVLLSVSDRQVDRSRAKTRAEEVSPVMTNISFTKAQSALPTTCFALMQNVSTQEQRDHGNEVAALAADKSMDEDTKVFVLGLSLSRIVGTEVLRAAVTALGARITK